MAKNKFLYILLCLMFISATVSAQNVPEETTAPIADDLISVSFQNVDVNQLITVLSDITRTTIIPHEGLTGDITIVSLEKVPPEVVINVLESALMSRGFALIRSGDTIKVVPLPETKQTNVEVKIGSASKAIEDLDIIITQVMDINYSSALQLKTILQPLIGKHGNLIANERTNTLIITDTSANIKRLATIIEQMDVPLPPEIQVRTFSLNFGDAEKISEILNDLSKDNEDLPYPTPGRLMNTESLEIFGEIQAYPESNTSSIVVASAPVNFPAIEQLIGELDIFPPQAMIEVIIMDILLGDDFKMGIEFSDATNPSSTTAGIKKDLSGNGFRESTFHSLLGLATDAATSGFSYRMLNQKETMQALAFINQTQENSKVLSTPRILASNNQESSITIAQEIPIIESSTTDLINNVSNVDFRYEDVGLVLNVTPRISRDGYINMKIHAELKDLAAQQIFDASVINKREADATVIVPDRYTVVLGGLMRDNNSDIEQKVPFLGDIPILGAFFKKTETALLKSELVFFISPTIIHNTQDLADISGEANSKREQIEGIDQTNKLKKTIKEIVGYDRQDTPIRRHLNLGEN